MKIGGRILRVRGTAPVRQQQAGFTVIETMVVLAVTGALFVAIAATLSGRQNEAQFIRAIQSAQSQIQQVVDQVSSGFYPNNGNFGCANVANSVQISPVSNGQGTNQDCVFLGKVIQFGVTGTDPEEFRVYTIAGLRNATSGPNSPFANAAPTVVRVGTDYAGYSTAGYLQYGLKTLWVHPDGTTKNIGAIAFLMEPGGLSSGGSYSSSHQQVDLVPILSTTIPQDYGLAVSGIENGKSGSGGLRDPNLTNSAPINPANGVQICFVSSTTLQSGLMTIGGSGRQLLVKLDIKQNQQCQ